MKKAKTLAQEIRIEYRNKFLLSAAINVCLILALKVRKKL